MIIIPMAGMSSRFFKAGFTVPKYMLKANDKSIFFYSLKSFENYFLSENFVFIIIRNEEISSFIEEECSKLKISNYKIIELENSTKGQADTVYKGLKKLSQKEDEQILIFNIDTIRYNYKYPDFVDKNIIDGYLETFIGTGKNWSNVVPEKYNSDKVCYTAEKKELSEYCCTGIYYFKSANYYCEIFEKYSIKNMKEKELYVAPMYNLMVEDNKDIRFTIIKDNDIDFCGVPEEYYIFKNKIEKIKK